MSADFTDDEAMTTACEWLREHGVQYRRLTRFHLKIGNINFWPRTGTITVDGEDARMSSRGLPALARLVGRELYSVPTNRSDDAVSDSPEK